jgi:hypothetical protein
MGENGAKSNHEFAAGETEELPPAPMTSADSVRKDMTYSPSSEAETQQKQDDPLPSTIDSDIDPDGVRAVPGTGGPDDVGDVDVEPEDLELPWRE